ncbi:hypothetical protein PF002_g3319 [Phytophthora fragariae]|uniref:Uncharacterized protein n=1 Tax=Phytophthora fragariae TaxID=53985 RepID=A0A6A4ELY7_9STRA|nr:hypothetical protein PF002_g3319 [Phytophthora fragariae]KAE9326160.1 hypothetical protein PF001_g2582 [Phytophthora fragariae]
MMDVLVEYEALAARDANDAVGVGDHARLSVDEDDPAVIVTVVLVSYEAQCIIYAHVSSCSTTHSTPGYALVRAGELPGRQAVALSVSQRGLSALDDSWQAVIQAGRVMIVVLVDEYNLHMVVVDDATGFCPRRAASWWSFVGDAEQRSGVRYDTRIDAKLGDRDQL